MLLDNYLFDRLNGSFPLEHRYETSRIQETKDAWVLEVDMPGVAKDKVDISASGRVLEVRGERAGKEGKVTYKECFRLPEHLRSTADITASLDLGVLRITVPKKSVGEERLQIALS